MANPMLAEAKYIQGSCVITETLGDEPKPPISGFESVEKVGMVYHPLSMSYSLPHVWPKPKNWD
jgi:hypothetical protein